MRVDDRGECLAEARIHCGNRSLSSAQFLAELEQAANMERRMIYSEPPYYPRPVLEVLGQVALKNGRRAEAESAFRRALEQYPGSFRAQTGLRATQNRKQKAFVAGL